ncbi:MAG: hypothetical protein QM809_16145 [Gordonia sp. (in: high G+C Gram-positive bacteria)]|uniref:hypothetical protein n=1 Tax=Gordonia sp. (in: high G+C Gram-positive bacteria) TaxID=84139 RepID=UPI0039E3DC0B
MTHLTDVENQEIKIMLIDRDRCGSFFSPEDVHDLHAITALFHLKPFDVKPKSERMSSTIPSDLRDSSFLSSTMNFVSTPLFVIDSFALRACAEFDAIHSFVEPSRVELPELLATLHPLHEGLRRSDL